MQQRVAVVGPQLRRLGLGLRRSGAAASAFRLKKDCRHFTNERVAGVPYVYFEETKGFMFVTRGNSGTNFFTKLKKNFKEHGKWSLQRPSGRQWALHNRTHVDCLPKAVKTRRSRAKRAQFESPRPGPSTRAVAP